jgi:DNA-binding NarL/FixJ family response regulator
MVTGEIVRVLLVDDYLPIRKLLRTCLKSVPGIEVVGEAENGEAAVELMGKLLPDVVFMDVYMPIMDGIEATRRITSAFPDVKVIVFTSSSDKDTMKKMLEAGASGFLPKGCCGLAEVTSAVRTATEGKTQCVITE